ncbi:MAG TPA: DMT family transporter [Planctomycetota bacterium]|nr:DMT family transporter [Planctomycetota bacterium]HRR82410.1 DMT family transporter [Planctomycetota bacterium]HRT96114.1 DMT family transporter [Planctomycetota bacterium]
MNHPQGSRVSAVACLLAAMVFWGAIPIFLRYFVADQGLDPWAVNAVRYLVAAVFWLPVVVVLGRRPRHGGAPGRNVWRDALIPSAINVVAQETYGISPAYASAPAIGFTLRLSFLFTLLFGVLLIAEERRLVRRRRFIAGAALCLAGVAGMFAGGLSKAGSITPTGMAILLLSTVCWGGYAVSVRLCMAGYPVRLSFGVISLYTTGGLLALAAVFGRPSALAQASGIAWLAMVGSALMGIALGHVLYYRGIHRLGPVVSSGLLLATPFVTYAGAAVLLGETLTGLQVLGGVAVVGGGALLVAARADLERRRPAEPPADAPRDTPAV